MNTTIRYVTTVADDRHATELEVAPDGAARLFVGSNRDKRLRAIGRFETTLPPELLRRVGAAVGAPALAAAPSQATLVPDEAYRRIRLEGGGSALDKVVGERIQTPRAFADAEKVLDEAIDHARRSPVQALALRLGALPARVRTGKPQAFELQIGNVGIVALRLAAPARWGAGATAATLNLLRDDVAVASLRPEHQRFLAFTGADLVGSDPPLAGGDNFDLAPGTLTRLRFAPLIDVAPGRYRIEVNLEITALSVVGATLFDGALFTPAVVAEFARA